MDKSKLLASFVDAVESAKRIVFFGGAGVSTESGIPDFRSVDGLYNQDYAYPPEQILSHSFFLDKPEIFYQFYRDKMIVPQATPNVTHHALAKLEQQGKLHAIVTQNIDGLHQMAHSNHVLELHGSVHRNFCTTCAKAYGIDTILSRTPIPLCECGGIIKPDVVLYEEPLADATVQAAIEAIGLADLLIVGGTSLNVYPAAGLLQHYRHKNVIIINKSPTAYDNNASLVLPFALGEVFSLI
jgi:NAD-dependent deacetylase